jgi:hypothetical protein
MSMNDTEPDGGQVPPAWSDMRRINPVSLINTEPDLGQSLIRGLGPHKKAWFPLDGN